VALPYEAALLATLAILGWVALDVLLDPARRRRLGCVAALSLAALVWTAGTVLLLHARTPDEVIAARRLLFAGVSTLPAAWVWCALVAARPHALRRARRAFAALVAPGLAVWACLFVAPGVFIDWHAQPIVRGPLYYVNAVYSWTLIGVGAAILAGAARPAAGGSRMLQAVVWAGALLPLAANGAYVLIGALPWPWDPTPIALGVSAIAFRVTVIDVAWAAQHPPVARAELVTQMRDAVLVADRERRVVDWNPAAAKLLGGAIAEGARLDALVASALRGPLALDVREFPLVRRSHRFGFGVVLADRTEQRDAEVRLEMATRLEAVGYLTAGVAHEINNPLTYLSANLSFLEPLIAAVAREPDALPAPLRALAEEAPQLAADAREGTERIRMVVERLAAFVQARTPDEALGATDLCAAAERAAAMACFGKRLRPIGVRAASRPVLARAVESDVIHIVFHLLLNAMQIGGDDVPITVEITSDGEETSVRIADQGPGIAEHDLPHLFEPFFTTRRPGAHMGLGLSLCWELARRSGGHIVAENRPTGGAAFTLRLPAAPSAY
jgi:signal transduction histidine kinase